MLSGADQTPGERSSGSPTAAPVLTGFEAAGRQLRAPWAASVAGLLFAVFFIVGLLLLRSQPMLGAGDLQLALQFAQGQDLSGVIGGLYLAPLAGIMFLWFIAVIRDQIGKREDQFFATAFLGSGLLFVAILFVASAVASWPAVGYRYLGQQAPTAREVETTVALAYALFFAFDTRAASVFVIAMATIGIRSGVFPRWFAWAGYLIGIMLFIVVVFWDWVVLIFPIWIGLVSLYILRRERVRHRVQG